MVGGISRKKSSNFRKSVNNPAERSESGKHQYSKKNRTFEKIPGDQKSEKTMICKKPGTFEKNAGDRKSEKNDDIQKKGNWKISQGTGNQKKQSHSK